MPQVVALKHPLTLQVYSTSYYYFRAHKHAPWSSNYRGLH